MADLDLLVRPEQMERVGPGMEGLGFHRCENLPAHMIPFQEALGGGVEWIRKRNGFTTSLDVQHDPVGVDWCRRAFCMEPDAVWAAARPLPLGGVQVKQLSAEDTLIHLCLHPALQHGYAVPLTGYVDMDRLIGEAGSDLFWARLVERARRFRVKMAVYWGLLAAQRLLDTAVPAEVLAQLAPRGVRVPLLRRLAPLDEEEVLQGVDRGVSGVKQVLLYAVLAARYTLKGKGQARLYRVVHPFRVGRAFLRGLHRPLVESSLE